MILQVVVTIAAVLGLIAGLYWVARRYSAGALGRLGRGRVPRLAVVDAAAVDGRRQLVLVRRDNVEHLILIGGPSDIVVEQGIQRRRRQPGEQPADGASEASGSASRPENPPIPFPQTARSAAPAPEASSFAAPAPRRAAASSSFFAAPRGAESDAMQMQRRPDEASEQQGTVAFSTQAETAPVRASFTAVPAVEPPPPAPTPYAPPTRGLADPAPTNGSAPSRPDPQATAFELPSTPESDDTAAKVNDLEREMARLLGEITAGKRP